MHTETFHVLKKLESYPTFDVDSIANIIKKDNSYAKLYLYRLEKRGLVHKIQRNVYTVQNDPFVIASRIIWPGYISLWSALRYHNLTEQLPNEISVITTSAKKLTTISAMNATIEFYRIKPKNFFGFSKIMIDGLEVFVAEPEKAILDSVLLRRVSFSEIYSILEDNRDKISMDKLVDHIIRTGNIAAAKRFGWALEKLGFAAAERLRPLSYNTRIKLDYTRPSSDINNNRWGINENVEVST